jgi:hypothetical protein
MSKSKTNFRDILRDELESISKDKHLQLDKNEHRGYIFSLFVAQLFMRWNAALDDSPDEVCSRGGNDKQVDIVLQDENDRAIYIIQSKCKNYARDAKPIERDPALAFLQLHDQLMSGELLKTANNFVKDALGGYKDMVNSGYRARFFYVTTEKCDDDEIRLAYENCNKRYDESALPFAVDFTLWDTNQLADTWQSVEAYDESIPDLVEINLPENLFLSCSSAKYPFLLGLLKGNSIRNEYRKKGRRDSLFAWNIRKYLGDRGINKEIKRTAEEDPEKFFYCNNGITAVCQDFTIEGNKLRIEKFQIINGAQTVASIDKAKADDRVWVLFRLIKTSRTDVESGINNEIIRSNNTQNAIKLSDFRANDQIQKFLADNLSGKKPSALPQSITYQPKRSSKPGRGRVIKLEELAKIRYAFLYDPLVVHSSPRDLWTHNDHEAKYHLAFGVDGELQNSWSKGDLNECVFAIAVHDAAIVKAKAEREINEDSDFFRRFRFHVVSLARLLHEAGGFRPINSLLESRAEFDKFFDDLWNTSRSAIFMVHELFCLPEKDRISLFALVRSEKAWEKIKKTVVFDRRRPGK